MADKATILTAEGLAKLEAELEQLRTVKRVQNSERIKVAISYGDISENSEYDDAKNEQAFIEGRILELEQMISTATIIDDKGKKKKGVVGLGSTVVIEDMEPEDDDDVKQEYTLVGTTEADPFDGKISNESPIGAAILGKKVNSVVTVRTPSGDHKYKIIKVK
jgi:transcription elongation factor GreA